MAESNPRKSDRPRKKTSYLEDDIKFDYDIEMDESNKFMAGGETKRRRPKGNSPKRIQVHSIIDKNQDLTTLPPNDDESNHTVDYYTNGMSEAEGDDLSHHSLSPRDSKSKKKTLVMPRSGGFTCEICEKVCVDMASYKRHMKGHSSDRKFQCEICSKSFIDTCSLKRHMKIHGDERPFTCDICFKSFRDGPSLNRHQQTHMDRPRTFSCQTCGKAFTDKHGLTRHERTHTGLRPFECGVCGKTFSESGSFKRHEKIHTGIRKFSCIVCGKRFLEKQSLLRHQRVVCGVTEDTTKNDPALSLSPNKQHTAFDNLNSSNISNISQENGNLNTSSMSPKANSVSHAEYNPSPAHYTSGKSRNESPNKANRKPHEEPSLQSLMQKDPNLYAGISDLVESIDSYEQMLDLCGDNGHSQIDAALTRESEPMPDNLLCFECGEHLVDGENFRKTGKTFNLPLKNQFRCLNCEDEDGADYGEAPVLPGETTSADEPNGMFNGEMTGQGAGNFLNSPTEDGNISNAENKRDNKDGHDESVNPGDFKDKIRDEETKAAVCGGANVIPGTEESLEHFRERLRAQHGVYFLGEMYPHLLTSMPVPQDDTDSTTASSTNASVSRSSSTEDADLYGQDLECAVTFQQTDIPAADADKKPHPAKRKDQLESQSTPDESLMKDPGRDTIAENASLSSIPSVPKPVYAADESGIPSVFPCHLCTKVFSSSAFLARHLYLHKNSPHKCVICGKTFTNAVSLRRHITTHTGEKPYACPVCNKRFRDPSNFSKHKKICISSLSTTSPGTSDFVLPPESSLPPPKPKRKSGAQFKGSLDFSDTGRQTNPAVEERLGSETTSLATEKPNGAALFPDHGDNSVAEEPGFFQPLNGTASPNCNETSVEDEPGFFQPLNQSSSPGHTETYVGDQAEMVEAVNSAASPDVECSSDIDDEDVDLPVSFGELPQGSSALTLDASNGGEDDLESLMISEVDNSGYFNSLSDFSQNEGKDLEMSVHCGVCERSFLKEKDLHRHMRFHSAVNPDLTCEECGKTFNDSSSLKRHSRIHADIRPHVCEFCHRGYCDNWSLRKHQSRGCLLSELQVPLSFMVPCPQCNRVFATAEIQAEHIAAVHKGALKFECDICLKRFSEAFNLKRHRRLHMAVCPGCEQEFKDVKLLAEHQRTECPAAATVASMSGELGVVVKEDNFPCPECGRVYTTKANLERHKKFHSALKPYVCEVCPKRFSEAFKLKRHMKVHSESKPHVCSNCNKGFSNAQGLRQHLLKTKCLTKTAAAASSDSSVSHPQQEWVTPPPAPTPPPLPSSASSPSGFPCHVCGKVFQKKFLLVRHMNVHSVERPYICGQCGRAYKDTSSLKRHCLVHRGVKDFICPDCGKAFFYSDSLKRHRNGLCGRTSTQAEHPLAPPTARTSRKKGRKKKSKFSIDVLNNNKDSSAPNPSVGETSDITLPEKRIALNSGEYRDKFKENSGTAEMVHAIGMEHNNMNEQEKELSSGVQLLPQCPIRLPPKLVPIGPWSCTKGCYCWRCSVKFPSNTELMDHLVIHRHKKRYISRHSYHRWARKCYLKSELKSGPQSVRVYTSTQAEVNSPLKLKLKLLHTPSSGYSTPHDSGLDALGDEIEDQGYSNPRPKRSISRARWSWISQIQ